MSFRYFSLNRRIPSITRSGNKKGSEQTTAIANQSRFFYILVPLSSTSSICSISICQVLLKITGALTLCTAWFFKPTPPVNLGAKVLPRANPHLVRTSSSTFQFLSFKSTGIGYGMKSMKIRINCTDLHLVAGKNSKF